MAEVAHLRKDVTYLQGKVKRREDTIKYLEGDRKKLRNEASLYRQAKPTVQSHASQRFNEKSAYYSLLMSMVSQINRLHKQRRNRAAPRFVPLCEHHKDYENIFHASPTPPEDGSTSSLSGLALFFTPTGVEPAILREHKWRQSLIIPDGKVDDRISGEVGSFQNRLHAGVLEQTSPAEPECKVGLAHQSNEEKPATSTRSPFSQPADPARNGSSNGFFAKYAKDKKRTFSTFDERPESAAGSTPTPAPAVQPSMKRKSICVRCWQTGGRCDFHPQCMSCRNAGMRCVR